MVLRFDGAGVEEDDEEEDDEDRSASEVDCHGEFWVE